MQNILLSSLFRLEFEPHEVPIVEDIENVFGEFFPDHIDFKSDKAVTHLVDGTFSLSITFMNNPDPLDMHVIIACYQILGSLLSKQNDVKYSGLTVMSNSPFYCVSWEKDLSIFDGFTLKEEETGRLATMTVVTRTVGLDNTLVVYKINDEHGGGIRFWHEGGRVEESSIFDIMRADGWTFKY